MDQHLSIEKTGMAFYNPSMNMMRQSIAMSLGVLGFEYWKNAEKKNAFICVIIAFLFHTSSLLILLIYLLYSLAVMIIWSSTSICGSYHVSL